MKTPPPWPPHRPPWWPPDEAWPPSGPPSQNMWRIWRRQSWRRQRWHGPFFWRIAGLVLFLLVFTVGGCALTLGLTATILGMLHFPGSDLVFSRAVSLAALLIGVAGFLFAGRALRRLAISVDDLMEAAERVAAGDYTAQVAEQGPREMRALARAFNSMATRLQQISEQRRNMLADVTHELRTPLTVIQGNLEGLIDGIYPSDEAHLTPILEETQVLARLIDDLRTLALAESGALRLQKELTDLGVLLNEAAASFRTRTEASGARLTVALADDLPLVEADPARIREVLTNLISNALRYTPPAGEVRVRGWADAGRQVIVSVSDTGPGIAADILPHIFDRFYKSADSGGMGLGLAIAKNLVAAHGGEISAQSTPGDGTTIQFTLPL
jgi:two-component system, OmpR family, sensor kinase